MNTLKTEEFHIPVPNGTIYVKTWIPEKLVSEIPIILLHDSLGSVGLWRDFPALLSQKLSHRVVAYDRLGFGKSDARVDLPSIAFIEEEATVYFQHIKTHLSVNKYILIGHSVGGSMAINIASRDADCVAVVTMAAQAFVEEITIAGIEKAKVFFEQPGQNGRLEKWHGEKARWVLRAWTEVWLSAEFSDWSLQSCIHHVGCPVLAIHGDNDEYGSNAFPEFIVGNTGGASTLLILENCGHMPHKEKTAVVLNAIDAFIAE